MSEATMDRIETRIVFTMGEGENAFTDALTYSPEEYAAMSEADIQAAKQERYDNWQAHIAAASEAEVEPPAVPTPEDRQARIEALAANVAVLNEQLQLLVQQEQAPAGA